MSKLLTGLDDSAVDTGANDMMMAKEIADTLMTHYPQHLWAVHVDGKNGVADIRNMHLSGQMGYLLKLTHIFSASQFKRDVVKAGGEILERFRLSRGSLNESEYSQLKTNFAGDFLFDK